MTPLNAQVQETTASQALDSRTVCVVDLDNLLHRGFDKRKGEARAQAQLDILRFAGALKERGMTSGTVCRNWTFSVVAEQLWRRLGFRVVAASSNCDQQVIDSVEAYAAEIRLACLILVSGDGGYSRLVKSLRNRGIFVEVWCRRANVAATLAANADRVRWIDEFLAASAAERTFDSSLATREAPRILRSKKAA